MQDNTPAGPFVFDFPPVLILAVLLSIPYFIMGRGVRQSLLMIVGGPILILTYQVWQTRSWAWALTLASEVCFFAWAFRSAPRGGPKPTADPATDGGPPPASASVTDLRSWLLIAGSIIAGIAGVVATQPRSSASGGSDSKYALGAFAAMAIVLVIAALLPRRFRAVPRPLPPTLQADDTLTPRLVIVTIVISILVIVAFRSISPTLPVNLPGPFSSS